MSKLDRKVTMDNSVNEYQSIDDKHLSSALPYWPWGITNLGKIRPYEPRGKPFFCEIEFGISSRGGVN